LAFATTSLPNDVAGTPTSNALWLDLLMKYTNSSTGAEGTSTSVSL